MAEKTTEKKAVKAAPAHAAKAAHAAVHAHTAKASGSKKAKVVSVTGSSKGDVALPEAFSTEYRPDIILRAFSAEQSWDRQPYGSDPDAGFKTTAEYFGRRREYYRMTVNKGQSRLPRQTRPGGGLGAVKRVPHSKGGHRAHPPKAEKDWTKKINGKEWKLALNSAIAATSDADLAKGAGRSHVIGSISLPLVIDGSFESVKKTKDVYDVFEKIGLGEDVARAAVRKTKSGKARTGKTKLGKSVLVVVSGDCPVAKAAENIAGVDVVEAGKLTISALAPGGHPGRLTLWTEKAIEKLNA